MWRLLETIGVAAAVVCATMGVGVGARSIGPERPVMGGLARRAASLPPKWSAVTLGNATSNFPNIFRDGGGGGMIDGKNYIIFSDGIYTSDGALPAADLSNWANFTSNSIALIDANGGGPTDLGDFGTSAKGPLQSVPYFYSAGESESKTGVWPQQNIATLCDGKCGVSFPVVVQRTPSVATLYSTGLEIRIQADGTPVVTRPVKALFNAGEPLYGTFSTMAGIDGYLYLFAPVYDNSPANGLKMARVPQGQWSDRSAYRYWDGSTWSATMPNINDEASAIFKFSTQCLDATKYGPHNGDLFYSPYYGVYMLIIQPADAGCDDNVYMSYSSKLEGGWSEPVSIYKIPSAGSYSYSLHAYPTLDPSGKTLALSFTQQPATGTAYFISWAMVTFE